MPKMATKAADNVFYKARIAAASWNDRLGSREGASEVTGIDRTRLANIELGTIKQLSGDADAVRVLGQRDARRALVRIRDGAVDGPLVGKEGEQALLDRVFFIMPNELELHKGVRSFLS